MNDQGKKRWLIRDKEGRVKGPYFTDDILARIQRGEITGEEYISLYPNTDWIPISNDSDFYDQLLASLDEESLNIKDEVKAKISAIVGSDDDPLDDFIETKSKAENTPTPRPIERPEAAQPIKNRAEKISEKKPIENIEIETEKTKTAQHKTKAKEKKKSPQPDIELKQLKDVVKKAKAKKYPLPIAIILLALFLAYLLMPSSNPYSGDRIQLLYPQPQQPALSEEQVRVRVQKAVSEFLPDNYSNYLRAQSELVQILEGDPKNVGAIALTCLTYLELWPFAMQDSRDLLTVSQVAQMASRVDPAGVEAGTCRVVDLLVRGQMIEAKGVTEMVLDTYGRSGSPPIAFYYFKALLNEDAKDYSAAINYAQSAEQLWPQWLRVHSLEASLFAKLGKYNEAANKYRSVLKSNPNHIVSQIELGIIEYKHLQNYQEGQKLLRLAMSHSEKAPANILAKGYLSLAEIALSHKNESEALNFAQKSYSLNPSNVRTKEIILKIGGEKKLRETKINDLQFMYEGDQLVREGDCNSAQAHYKAAYELNKNNGVAAMKAAECLWAISLSSEAIMWLDNAIRADPKLIDAYVLLADYYSQRFNFMAAARILSKASSQNPKSYKVFRGFALVEWRRNNYAGAANYALKAVEIYEADVESHVILSRARVGLGEFAKGFESAGKAIEIDMNNRQAQIAYAEALAATKGNVVGTDYLERLVNTYPTISDYRLALAQLYVKDQNYGRAQQLYTQVIKFEEKPKVALIELGKVFHTQKMFEEAKEAYFKAAALDPSDVQPLFLAGTLFLEFKRSSEAREQFQRVLRVNPDYPLVNYYMGSAALQMGSTSEALEQAKIEKAKNPNLADPYLLAAEAYTEMKQYSACAGEYQLAVKLRPVNADLYVKMARCYRLSGNFDAAVSMINQASRQESGNPEVWKEQGAIFEMRQEAIKAIEAYNQYLVLAPNAPDKEQIVMKIQSLSR